MVVEAPHALVADAAMLRRGVDVDLAQVTKHLGLGFLVGPAHGRRRLVSRDERLVHGVGHAALVPRHRPEYGRRCEDQRNDHQDGGVGPQQREEEGEVEDDEDRVKHPRGDLQRVVRRFQAMFPTRSRHPVGGRRFQAVVLTPLPVSLARRPPLSQKRLIEQRGFFVIDTKIDNS